MFFSFCHNWSIAFGEMKSISFWGMKCYKKAIDKSLRKESKVVQTKKQLWFFDNCPFVCISFDFSWLNKGASGQPLYMGFQFWRSLRNSMLDTCAYGEEFLKIISSAPRISPHRKLFFNIQLLVFNIISVAQVLCNTCQMAEGWCSLRRMSICRHPCYRAAW